jgi:hypothetical protein
MKKYLFVFLIIVNSLYLAGQQKHLEIIPKLVTGALMTDSIQSAIDRCAASGGGIVRLRKGTYKCGGIQLKNNITLFLEKGAILQGSDKYADYKNDAFIYGRDLSDISIQGEGIIDGVDCYNPKGEEGFRGPHCIRLINCKNISFSDFTIMNSANWAFNLRYCSFGTVERVLIRGGHDGLHTRFCNNFTVRDCDFRTGDDSFAGNDNRNFMVTGCKINTSCNGFRMGCDTLTVKHCKFWGPGEYSHKIQKRNNMLSAFVHFSPKDENPKLQSGNWLIQNCTVDQVDNFYIYNFEKGLWQTGQPVTSLRFEKIKATGLLKSFSIVGDKERKLNLIIKNSSFAFREGSGVKETVFEGVKSTSEAFFSVSSFGYADLQNVTLQKDSKDILIEFKSGDKLVINGLHPVTVMSASSFKDVKQIIK